jgi:carboxymethylenebutenolidase
MDLATGWITYDSAQGDVPAYRAKPGMVAGPLPAVLVIQEAWGPDDHIQDVTRRVAASGYLALAPDLYAVGCERPEALGDERLRETKAFLDTVPPTVWTDERARREALDRLPEAERARVAESIGAFSAAAGDLEALVPLLRAAVGHVRADPDAAGRRVGSVGFCMGGGLSALLACSDPELSAAVVFYGRSPSEERLQALACPLLGLYGEADRRLTDTVPAMAKAIAEAGGSFEHHAYPAAPHAFFNDTRPTYRVEAARDAWARTLGFFARHLTPS